MKPAISHTDAVLTKVFALSRAIGTFPLDRSFKVTKGTTTRSLALLIFTSIASPYILVLNCFNHRRLIKAILFIILNMVSFVVLIRKRCQIGLMYKRILKVEEELAKEGIVWKWMPSYFRLYTSQLFLILDLILIAVIRYESSSLNWAVHVILFAMLCFPLAISIISQLTAMQAVLSSLFNELFKVNETKRTLEIMSELFSVGDLLMSIYGIQALFFTTITVLFIVTNVYYLSYSNFSKMTTVEWSYVLSIFITFYPFMDMIVSSSRATSKSREVNELLCKKMIEDKTDTLINNELLVFHLNSCRELEFSACGFFKFNNSLIFTIFACSTTYLVILTQYRYPGLVADGPTNMSELLRH